MSQPKPGAPDLAFLILHAARVIDHRIRTAMDTHGVPKGQSFILSLLNDHGCLPQGEIARILHITPASVTGMVQPLEREGLLERKPTPGDDRGLSVSLTERGRLQAENIRAVLDHVEREVCSLVPHELHSPLRKATQVILQTWGHPHGHHHESTNQERK